MMTLDDYILEIEKTAQHYFELVESNNHGFGFLGNGEENCLNYAKKHKQLADFLTDYKRLLESKTGEWIYKPQLVKLPWDKEPTTEAPYWNCSECGYEVYGSYKPRYNFCPKCGVDMRQMENRNV